jgi:hypothetical protein
MNSGTKKIMKPINMIKGISTFVILAIGLITIAHGQDIRFT